jgi:hypothetical protein
MLITSDFLGHLNRKKRETERDSSPLVKAALKASPGGKEKSPPVDQKTGKPEAQGKDQGEVEYLNERRSTLNVVL